ncbi:MAG: diguanylate cyclase [Actinomycetota bacterium]|nr:diguanylate cyclase [Actinomycetota bacterium]
MNDIRVLLVEGDLDDAQFIGDALAEMEETTHGGAWVHCRLDHLQRAEDAIIVLENEQPDIVLFSPVLPDSRGLETFSAFRDAAPTVPLIALLEAGEEGLGRRMLRLGAQDFVLKAELDCQPLARAMLNAIERQRFQKGTQLASATDLETGLYNNAGFRAIGARDVELAREVGRGITLLLAEVDHLVEVDEAYGREATHDLVIQAANVIRAAAGGTALIARVALGRFALLTWQDTADVLIARLQEETQSGHHAFAFVFGYATSLDGAETTLEELLETAEAALYENRQAYCNLA